eukprot:Nk52_evm62s745 gene=Nk52_evmTU62s745
MGFFHLTFCGSESVFESHGVNTVKKEDQHKDFKPETSKPPLPETGKITSAEKYHGMLRKNQRTSYGPRDVYARPVTTSQEMGWDSYAFAPGAEGGKKDWAIPKQFPNVNSEMTKFQHDMRLADPSFF